MKRAVVIFSGGQDSTSCLFFALKRFEYVEAITFDYGQNHDVELIQSAKICLDARVRQTVVDLSFLGDLVDSALTSKGNVNELNAKGLPASFVPNRNQLFITLAHAYAQKIGAEHLITGVCQTDYSGYPDCRQSFIDAVEHTSNLGSDSRVKILTPLMYLSKAEIFDFADLYDCLDVVLEDSHTCYNGDRSKRNIFGYGCNKCPACELRRAGYLEYSINKTGI